MRPTDWPDLTPSYKSASSQYASHAKRVTYTVSIRNGNGPLPQPVLFTDTVPMGMVYMCQAPLPATTGIVADADAPTLRWSGVLTPSPAITVSYATIVTYTLPGSTVVLPSVIINTATIAAPGYQTVTRTASVRIDWQSIHLPLVLKENVQ